MADAANSQGTPGPEIAAGSLRPIGGLLTTQFVGAFNDNAWKQFVILLAIAAAASESQGQGRTALAQIVLMVPLMAISLPAGVLADRVGKRSIIVWMKVAELGLMVLGTAALVMQPAGGWPVLAILGLLGVQAALYSPAKYGILPEILPHAELSRGNGLLEMYTNVAIIGGTVAAGPLFAMSAGRPWLAGLPLVLLSGIGLLASLRIPTVAPARREGGLSETLRMAFDAIRGDRVLRLAVIGQIIVWSIASLIPAPVLPYARVVLHLDPWLANLPLGALGIGIGVGCYLAGSLSGKNVEYGLLPVGALGMSLSALGFATWGPGLYGMMLLLGLLGFFAGFLLVPLNAVIQWRAPADRRGAVIAATNVLVYGGMLAGSVLALGLAGAEVSGRGMFLLIGLGLGVGFFWALTLVPEAFLRFLMLGLANTIYRVRVVGGEHIPREGQALLVPNHVSFVDGLFIMRATDRPVRFVVYAEYFKKPILGRLLRAMRAIPISASGGPRMILQAFREAGRALDAGELVCIFPEGQLSRTGLIGPFQRGLQRIVKNRTTPIIPVHLDRLYDSVFAPVSGRRLPERIPFPATVSVGEPLPPSASLFEMRQAIRDLDYAAETYRKADCRPLHHGFIRQVRRNFARLALADLQKPSLSYGKTLAASLAIAHRLRPRWEGQANVGVMLPASMGAAVINIGAALAGKAVVNLNFTGGRAAMESAARQAGLKTLVVSRQFLQKAKLEAPRGLELIYAEDEMAAIGRMDKLKAMAMAMLAPIRAMERYAGASRPVALDDPATIIFSSGSTGEPKGVVLSHYNIVAEIEAIRRMYRVLPNDRLAAILPFFHSFGYTMFWFANSTGMGSVFHPTPLDALAVGTLVERFSVTVLMATPTFLNLYVRRCAPGQFGSLRLVLAGAERLPESLSLAFEEAFGIRPMEGYGVTECSPVVSVNCFDYRAPGSFQPGSRRGYVGQPIPGVTIRIVSPTTYEPLGANTEGLVFIKGPNVMAGYLGRDDLTRQAFVDGWYNSGDLGMLSEDGFLKITGRLSRFSKIGGEMVPHGRVEEALQDAAKADSQLFAVTAVGDEKKGEKLAVLTTLDDGRVDEALRRLAEMGLPNLFIPRRDHIFKVPAIPMLGSGKLDLRAVHKLAEDCLAAREPAGSRG
ncbi:MFS transporter [Planctomyces sp. SH-PL62]|uniref:MFS transporter n=1 Tax=Planctomyces sp. SH-PL62 TaxID=1636152 RepID=UPI00078CC377|nr:MFS transporter [Planctomyces sp. SH-PL62]AMV39272.1 Bifunctional protein Aas [Planctomyces sp. SH-PL62]